MPSLVEKSLASTPAGFWADGSGCRGLRRSLSRRLRGCGLRSFGLGAFSGGRLGALLGGAAGNGGFDVVLDDAAVGAAALDLRQVQAGLLRHALGERAGEDAVAGLGGSLRRSLGAVALGQPEPLRERERRFPIWLRACGFRLGSGLRTAAAFERGGVFALFQQQGDHLVDVDALGPFLNDDLAERAFIDRFDFHGGFVGLDLGDDVAGLDLVAFLLQPLREVALGHCRRQRRHSDFDRHLVCPPDGAPAL